MKGARLLENVKALKACRAGERVSFRARVLRAWEMGGLRMCLVGDESALMRVDLGEATVQPGLSYEFHDALVREYPSSSLRAGPGGWHSASMVEGSSLEVLSEDIPISQDEAYIEFTYKILTGVQRKKARREGRVEQWRHPAAGEPRT